jgi:hypothetical protein
MPNLFLLPFINIFDVHDFAIREWLNKLDEPTISNYLEYPFRLDRFFLESSRHAIKSVEEVHAEIIRLLDIISPQAVFLDIPEDCITLENDYNKRKITPLEFWSKYYQISTSTGQVSQELYNIYIKGVIEKNKRLIENKEHLPYTVVFYGLPTRKREELIPVYEHIFDIDSEFVLMVAQAVNEITSLREKPKHLWYSPMQERHMAVSYEETEKFYDELLNRMERFLKFKIRNYFVKSLDLKSMEFISAYEKFLDNKQEEDYLIFSNIISGLKTLITQSECQNIVIFCGSNHYSAIFEFLKKEKRLDELGLSIQKANISILLNKLKPFVQKNRIMENNYEFALNISERKKPERFTGHFAHLLPE